jgi:hypothetical protein
MKRIVLLVVLVVFAAGSAYAHGKEEHVMGTVTAVTASTITVQTKDKDPVIVYTTAETKYEKSGAVASMQDLQVGTEWSSMPQKSRTSWWRMRCISAPPRMHRPRTEHR